VVKHLFAKVTTIDDLLSGDADLSDFYAMLQGANFTGKLKEARNITVIVVNNAQIRDNLKSQRRQISRKKLTRQLAYHAFESTIDLDDHRRTKTAKNYRVDSVVSTSGRPVHISQYPVDILVTDDEDDSSLLRRVVANEGTAVQCVRVSKLYHKNTCAGSVLVLDKLLPLPSPDILAVLSGHKEFSIILDIISGSNLERLFTRDTDYTFLAPTNEVFHGFAPFIKKSLFENSETAWRIISYHLIKGYRCSDELSQQAFSHLTLSGKEVTSCPKAEGVKFGNGWKSLRATLTTPDLIADNGIVHGINNILLPEHFNATLHPIF